MRDAVRVFKYEKKVVLARTLGRLLTETAAGLRLQAEVIIPVPLHPSRLRERGFNQSLLLADRLARQADVPLQYTNLVRVRQTPAQTELRRAARAKNLRRAFAVSRPDDVAGRRILLVDDVYTTGTTVNECAKALRKAGAADVTVLTLARAIPQ
jgi:ComF family protein